MSLQSQTESKNQTSFGEELKKGIINILKLSSPELKDKDVENNNLQVSSMRSIYEFTFTCESGQTLCVNIKRQYLLSELYKYFTNKEEIVKGLDQILEKHSAADKVDVTIKANDFFVEIFEVAGIPIESMVVTKVGNKAYLNLKNNQVNSLEVENNKNSLESITLTGELDKNKVPLFGGAIVTFKCTGVDTVKHNGIVRLSRHGVTSIESYTVFDKIESESYEIVTSEQVLKHMGYLEQLKSKTSNDLLEIESTAAFQNITLEDFIHYKENKENLNYIAFYKDGILAFKSKVSDYTVLVIDDPENEDYSIKVELCKEIKDKLYSIHGLTGYLGTRAFGEILMIKEYINGHPEILQNLEGTQADAKPTCTTMIYTPYFISTMPLSASMEYICTDKDLIGVVSKNYIVYKHLEDIIIIVNGNDGTLMFYKNAILPCNEITHDEKEGIKRSDEYKDILLSIRNNTFKGFNVEHLESDTNVGRFESEIWQVK